jgi:lipoprotein-anchoring transpeptidase ErfK/SrfK
MIKRTFPFVLLLISTYVAFALIAAQERRYVDNDFSPLADSESLASLIRGETRGFPTDDSAGLFHGKTVTPPVPSSFTPLTEVLGLQNTSDKRIEVDLTNQKTYSYEGSKLVYEFTVSTGLWGWTPTGEFTIWTKVRSQLMQGGSKEKGTYYYLPNVPYVMFFYNDDIEKMRGFSFHGAYWHNNFGHPMSHGCINMRNEDAKTLYEWATPVVTNTKAWSTPSTKENPGTKVIIYGKAPLY